LSITARHLQANVGEEYGYDPFFTCTVPPGSPITGKPQFHYTSTSSLDIPLKALSCSFIPLVGLVSDMTIQARNKFEDYSDSSNPC
jgi:hypothetical protein